jgi:hypothetical protein
MENSGDQSLVALIAIVDDIILDSKRADTRPELDTCATHSRLLGEQIESLDDVVNESIGGCRTGVLGDVLPDPVEVLLRKSGQPIGHLPLLGASRTTARLNPLGELPARGFVVDLTLASSNLI